MSNDTIYNFEIEQMYIHKTKQIIPFNANEDFSIGDVLIGNNLIICITYSNINLVETAYDWGLYIFMLCELLEWTNNKQKLKIYTNNNNNLLKHTSIESSNTELNATLDPLSGKFDIEVC
ncbi:hypothetical protein QKT26_gp75 [Carcinus maenas nudivirus]|uniref:Uncharacterized protein n=1 Tax=Carcinus maenas nudivirus TaxID=2880837 RepID=A0AAE9C007_9VIRU|nr:hypothetical protein QKT26_gp75 [Carcinus maenas nudivirus]UBZ25665.1 hypothetical protein CmNV_074 [Carcinus maenas nudivirus]